MRLDEEFNEVFSKKMLQSGEFLKAVNIVETPDMGYMLTWQKDLSFSLLDTFPYPTAIYKLDSLANVEWEYVFAHNSSKDHISTIKASNDRLFVVGATDYFTTRYIYTERWLDGWCFMIDMEGNLQWERSITDIRNSFGCSIRHGLETDDGFLLVGDIDVKTPAGVPFLNQDVWFLTLDENGCWNGNCNEYVIITSDSTSITDASEPKLEPSGTDAYPNPTAGILTFEYRQLPGTATSREVQVFDSNGKKVLECRLYAPKSTINLSHLPDGVYFMTHSAEGKLIETQKIQVHH
jgi:hypothetical protein